MMSERSTHTSDSFRFSFTKRVVSTMFALALVVVLVTCQLMVTGVPQLGEPEPYNEAEAVFFNEQLVAVLKFTHKGTITQCNLVETLTLEERNTLLADLANDLSIYAVSFEQLIRFMDDCIKLDRRRFRLDDSVFNEDLDDKPNPTVVFKGILPVWCEEGSRPPGSTAYDSTACPNYASPMQGTNWCGNGDIASNYSHMGLNVRADVCCREHDLCPIKLKAFRAGYELFNFSPVTRSHCVCDMRFFDCLKTGQSSTNDKIGSIYFDVLRLPCINTSQPCYGTEGCSSFQKIKGEFISLSISYDSSQTQ